MKLLSYMQPHRGGGVARHANAMVKSLSEHDGVELSLFSSKPEAETQATFRERWRGYHSIYHPFPERMIERCWKTFNWPKMDRYTDGFDWVYAPAEVRLPVKRTPVAVTVHDVQAFETSLPWSNSPAHLAFRRKWALWLPKMLREVQKVLTVSEFSKRRMVELLAVDPDKISVIGNGVDPIFYRAGGHSLTKPLQRESVVVLGGLRLKKGAEATLAVARRLKQMKSPIMIDIIGQNDKDLIDRAQAYENVRLHGMLPDDEVAAHLARSVALLFLTPYEGFGIPALEAMAAGTPAVTSNCASLPEVVGHAGLIYDPEASHEVADILERLRLDAVFRNKYVQKGFIHARSYTWDACVQRLMDALTSQR